MTLALIFTSSVPHSPLATTIQCTPSLGLWAMREACDSAVKLILHLILQTDAFCLWAASSNCEDSRSDTHLLSLYLQIKNMDSVLATLDDFL